MIDSINKLGEAIYYSMQEYKLRPFALVRATFGTYRLPVNVESGAMKKVLEDMIILLDDTPIVIQDEDGTPTLLTYFKYCSDAIERFGDKSNPILKGLKWHMDRFFEIALTEEQMQLLKKVIQETKDLLPYQMPGLSEQVLEWLDCPKF